VAAVYKKNTAIAQGSGAIREADTGVLLVPKLPAAEKW
jgi:hypothetical protein